MALSDKNELVHESSYELHFVARLILRDDAYRNRHPSPRWSDLSRESQEAYLLLAYQRIQVWNYPVDSGLSARDR
jgi:hypothetical protein